jgi:hypothetical protein
MHRLLAIVVVCASLSLSAAAQHGGFAGHAGGGHLSGAHFGGSPAHFGGSLGHFRGSPGHFGGGPAGFGPFGFFNGFGPPGQGALISLEPFFGFGTGFGFDGGFFPFLPWFYEDDWDPNMAPAPASQPQVIVIREPAAQYGPPPAALPPAKAKVIEVPGSSDVAGDHAAEAPATLVLRDGKEITVSRYMIMGQYLYDSSRPRHTTRIPLDQLDLQATERLNAQHGVPFAIPADSSEVMVRF